ncbi:MAG: NAD-dependent epimerase/dehydratase family protein [Actinomycetota bacterium]
MSCLVTGAAGFIGSRLGARLIAEGDQVVGLDDLSEGSVDNLSDCPEIELVEADLRDEAAVGRAAKGCDVIFHQGAMRSVPRSMQLPGLTSDVNVRGTLNVLLAAHENGARVVSASSSSVYGDQTEFPLHEGMTPEPRSPYAASKMVGEVYCKTWWRAYSVPAISLRYFNVFGPRQDPSSEYATLVPRFVLACMKGDRPVIHSDGEQARDFTYIDDAVEGNFAAARAPEAAFGEAFNIGGGQDPTSVNEILAIVAELTGTRPDPIFTDPRPGDVRLTHADLSRSAELLGYKPQTTVRQGLEQTVTWFAEHFGADPGR